MSLPRRGGASRFDAAVVDTSVLVSLGSVARFDLLTSCIREVLVPREVVAELRLPAGHPRKPMCDILLGQLAGPQFRLLKKEAGEAPGAGRSLGAGERAMIAVALAESITVVLTDDLPARILANQLGLEVHGSLGIVIVSNHAGLLDKQQADLLVTQLLHAGLRASPDVIVRCLGLLG